VKIQDERRYIKELMKIISEAQENSKRDKVTYQVCRCGKHLVALPANDGMDAWSDVLLEIST
jgi:hypothetical protein